MRICLLALLLVSGLSFHASAQSFCGPDIQAQFIKEWTRAKDYTMEYLNAMPADKYSFKAVDSIRSFAQQMLHLASGNVGLINLATAAPFTFAARGLEQRTSAQTKDSVVYYVMASYDFAIQSIKSMDPNKMGEMVTVGKEQVSRFAVLLKAFEHQTHHRGQTTIYIRLLGIRPPNERLF